MTAAPIITFEEVSKRFGTTLAVDRVSLEIMEGEFFALLGPSGCGKTTLLRLLAGFETPSAGRILIDGRDVRLIPPNRRPVSMVFQSYAVFPHMSVAQNVAFGLKVDRVPADERRRRVTEALALVKLEGLEARRPDQLSSGQKQRVALARALVKRPRVLLLDEPLSALDAKLREAMRLELTQLQKTVGVTFVFVTHDQVEALTMASRCAVMTSGALEQVDIPARLYEQPRSRFVANFIGQMNLIEGHLAEASMGQVRFVSSDLPGEILAQSPGPGPASEPVWLAVRPEDIDLTPQAASKPQPVTVHPRFAGVVSNIAYLGSHSQLAVTLESGLVVKVARANRRPAESALAVGEQVWVGWAPQASRILLK